MASNREAAYKALTQKVETLKMQLPGITLGYIGNYERWGNDTVWYVFLPHPGRVGTYRDSVYLGPGRSADLFEKALAEWDGIESLVRKMYATDPNRREA